MANITRNHHVVGVRSGPVRGGRGDGFNSFFSDESMMELLYLRHFTPPKWQAVPTTRQPAIISARLAIGDWCGLG
jgi:hypothetical protein